MSYGHRRTEDAKTPHIMLYSIVSCVSLCSSIPPVGGGERLYPPGVTISNIDCLSNAFMLCDFLGVPDFFGVWYFTLDGGEGLW